MFKHLNNNNSSIGNIYGRDFMYVYMLLKWAVTIILWCGHRDKMHAEIFMNERVGRSYDDKIEVLKKATSKVHIPITREHV